MTWLWIIPCILLGAITYRIRGGLLERYHLPGQLARLSFAVALAVTALAAGSHILTATALIPAMFLGEAAIGNFNAIDLGRKEGDAWTDFEFDALHGFLLMLAPSIVLDIAGKSHAAVLMAAGGLMAPCYWIAWQSGGRPLGLRFGHSGDPVEMAEALIGCVYAAALFIVVKLGGWPAWVLSTSA